MYHNYFRMVDCEKGCVIDNSLFLSHLNYGITAWGFNVGPRIKTLQKKAIRFISNAKYNSHTTPMFKNLPTTTGSGHFQASLLQILL